MLRNPEALYCVRVMQDGQEVILKFKDGEASRGAVLSGLLFVQDQIVIETWVEKNGQVEDVERFFEGVLSDGS